MDMKLTINRIWNRMEHIQPTLTTGKLKIRKDVIEIWIKKIVQKWTWTELIIGGNLHKLTSHSPDKLPDKKKKDSARIYSVQTKDHAVCLPLK